jgi:hypothetical protein
MAFIHDDGNRVITKGASGTLAQVDFDRQLDVYRLALRGHQQCVRIWNDFQRQQPADARLIVKFHAIDQAERGQAVREVDAVLAKAERTPPPQRPAQPPAPVASIYSADEAERSAAWALRRRQGSA